MRHLVSVGIWRLPTRTSSQRSTCRLFSSASAISPAPLFPSSAPHFVEGALTRDFINAALYQPDIGYFNSKQRINSPTEPFDFTSLRNREEYYRRLTQYYAAKQSLWFTPVELFQPHYAFALARYILARRRLDGASDTEPLTILEIGGGHGTCANGVLTFLARYHPRLYAKTRYIIVDMSEQHSVIQPVALRRHLTSRSGVRVELRHQSILDWNERLNENVFVIGLEVLDNMPHDHVMLDANGQVLQAHVHTLDASSRHHGHDRHQRYTERWQPLTDEWIHEATQHIAAFDESNHSSRADKKKRHSVGSRNNRFAMAMTNIVWKVRNRITQLFVRTNSTTFVPTTALHLIHLLHTFMPNHRLILTDFVEPLPNAITGRFAPVVSGHTEQMLSAAQRRAAMAAITKSDNTTSNDSIITPNTFLPPPIDFRTYLISLGVADIFFPTDFEFLQFMYERVRAQRVPYRHDDPVTVLTHYEFMNEWSRINDYERTNNEGDAVVTNNSSSSSSTAITSNNNQRNQQMINRSKQQSPTQTKSGFDPLKEDYANVKFILS